ncbi:MAG: hypothetical protein FJ012_07315 [Chloroflexi bacterium]|nr:hypothetical protein [Chloroflexota bacterium]
MTQEPEYIHIQYTKPRFYRWSTGKYMGKVYKEARDNKKLVSNRCPKCKDLLWHPQVTCGRCNVYAGEDWVEMGQKGTVLQYTYLVFPMWNPHMGERWANPYPLASIKLDNGCYIYHFLEEQDTEKLPKVKRVQAVWKEEGRGRGLGDILYFRTIEE